jgi:hypothetical protein
VYAFYRLAGFFRRNQPHGHANPADYKYPFVQLHFTSNISRQAPVASINVARLQRTCESAQHSTGRCGDGVIQGGCVRLLNEGWIYFVVLGDCTVDAEDDWL